MNQLNSWRWGLASQIFRCEFKRKQLCLPTSSPSRLRHFHTPFGILRMHRRGRDAPRGTAPSSELDGSPLERWLAMAGHLRAKISC